MTASTPSSPSSPNTSPTIEVRNDCNLPHAQADVLLEVQETANFQGYALLLGGSHRAFRVRLPEMRFQV